MLEELLQREAKVRFDPNRLEALQVESFSLRPGEAFVSGVVRSLVRKETREVTIVVAPETALTLTIGNGTIIEKDGLRVPINEVLLGDLVRPTTHYDATTLEIRRLALKSPIIPVTGIVRGTELDGQVGRLTIPTPGLGPSVLLRSPGPRHEAAADRARAPA